MSFPGGSDTKESACSAGGLVSGSGRSPGERNGYPLQYSYPENSMDRGKELDITEQFSSFHHHLGASLVAQVVKNLPTMQETWVWSLVGEDTLEKGMATHSSILAWKVPRTEEPCGLWFMGSQQVGHHWATNTPMVALVAGLYFFELILQKIKWGKRGRMLRVLRPQIIII